VHALLEASATHVDVVSCNSVSVVVHVELVDVTDARPPASAVAVGTTAVEYRLLNRSVEV